MAQAGLKSSWTTSLTDVRTSAQGPETELGTVRFQGGKWYKYVQYSEATIAGTALKICYYLSITGNTVSCDISDCKTANGGIGAGQLQATLAHLSYGWIQIKGMSQALNVDLVGGAIGNVCSTGPAGVTDGTLDVRAAFTEERVGLIYDVTGSANLVVLDCPF